MPSHFVTAGRGLADAAAEVGIRLNTYDLLALIDALFERNVHFSNDEALTEHDKRVYAALGSYEVMQQMRADRKILAIKEIRRITQCGLRDAKVASEDPRVTDAAGLPRYHANI